MTGNLQAIGFMITWVLGWGIGGSLIDAGLINAGVYSLEGGQLGTAATFTLWSLLWGGGGIWLYRRWRGPSPRTVDPLRPLGRVDQQVVGQLAAADQQVNQPCARQQQAGLLLVGGQGEGAHLTAPWGPARHAQALQLSRMIATWRSCSAMATPPAPALKSRQ